jgi:hypothetical protein
MRSVSAAHAAAIAEGGVRLCEIYELELASGLFHRYTNHDTDITWDAGGNTYLAIPGLTRDPIKYSSDGQHTTCELTLGIQETSFLDYVQKHVLDAAKITHKRIRWDVAYAADEEVLLNIWRPEINFNRSALNVRLLGLLDSLNIQVPAHSYQEPCNHLLFDDTCGLSRAAFAYSSSATTGSRSTLTDSAAGIVYKVNFDNGDSGNPIAIAETITGGSGGYTAEVLQIVYLTSSTGTIWYCELSNSNNFNNNEVLSSGGDSVTVNGTAAEDTEFYQDGELEITSGNNIGERRRILSSAGAVRTVFFPFPYPIESADNYKIYPGCDYKPSTCQARFNNKTVWRGFVYVPPLEETVF